MPEPVIIVPYNPQWPGIYEKEKKRVLRTLGDKAQVIEHIGSTSVPGLGAKDIVDIAVGVKGRSEAEECRELLESIDFTKVTPQPDHTEWFYCLGKTPGMVPRFHLHLMKYPSPFWNKHIRFRDYLRAHPEVAREYFELKKSLADYYCTDRIGYTDAKTDFIEKVIEKAGYCEYDS